MKKNEITLPIYFIDLIRHATQTKRQYVDAFNAIFDYEIDGKECKTAHRRG